MSKLRKSLLKGFNYIGDKSGCHQIPSRCFCIDGYIFPLCARCTGAMIGQAIAVGFLLFGKIAPFLVALLLLLIMGADWFIQYVGLIESTNGRRFVTGILGGFGLFTIYFHIVFLVYSILKMLIT